MKTNKQNAQHTTQFNWNHISNDPYDFASNSTKEKLETAIEEASKFYYNPNLDALVDDAIYDILFGFLEETYPDSETLNKVGSEVLVVEKEKVTLPTYLPSMDKMKADTSDLEKWTKKFPGPYTCSDKLDGMSLLVYRDAGTGKLRACTRGNASVGQNISWITKCIKLGDLPADGSGMARGELVVSKKNFADLIKAYPRYKDTPARNFVAGYCGKKHVNRDMMKYIDFVAYEYITEPPMKFSQQFKTLEKMGFHTVTHQSLNSPTNKILSEFLLSRRNKGEYEVDGIILASDTQGYARPSYPKKYPDYAKAFKMVLDDQTAEVHVLKITWQPSKHGLLKPVVHVSPVLLDGAKIQRATGNNARFIFNNNIGGVIGPGAIVKLTRSGGVIPKILEVITPFKGDHKVCLPKEKHHWSEKVLCLVRNDGNKDCDFDGKIHNEDEFFAIENYKKIYAGVDLILDETESNKEVQLRRIEHFFKTLEVPFFKTGQIKKVFEKGFNTIYKILKMTTGDLLKIDGFKEKSAAKSINAIQKGYENATLVLLMTGHHSFGSGFGKRMLKPILQLIPNILDYDTTDSATFNKLHDQIVELEGYQTRTAEKFLNGLESFKLFYNGLPNREIEPPVVQVEKKVKIMGSKYQDQVFAYTGFRPSAEFTESVQSNGGILSDRVNGKVTHLIVKTKGAKKTKKIEAAEKKGIKIVYLDDFS